MWMCEANHRRKTLNQNRKLTPPIGLVCVGGARIYAPFHEPRKGQPVCLAKLKTASFCCPPHPAAGRLYAEARSREAVQTEPTARSSISLPVPVFTPRLRYHSLPAISVQPPPTFAANSTWGNTVCCRVHTAAYGLGRATRS